jgi:hypothetical protein
MPNLTISNCRFGCRCIADVLDKCFKKRILDLIDRLYTLIAETNKNEWFDDYLPVLGKSNARIKKEKPFEVENSFTDEYGKIQKVKSMGTPMQLLVNFRNKYLGHGTVISEEESLTIFNTYLPIYVRFLEQISFLNQLEIKSENGVSYKGLYYAESPSELIFSNKVIGEIKKPHLKISRKTFCLSLQSKSRNKNICHGF